MPHPMSIEIHAVRSTEPHNVTVTSADCETTSLGLICWKFGEAEMSTIYTLPVRKNGSTYFMLPSDHYVFAFSFQNVDGEAKVSIAVTTEVTPSTEPDPVPESSANPYEPGVTYVDVYV